MILDIFQTMKNVIKYHHIVLNIVCPNVNHIRKNWASSAKIQKIRLKPIGGGVFFVLENLWCVEICDWGGVPGGEIIRSFTDNGDQVVVALGMHLDIRQQLKFVGLQGADDPLFDRFAGAVLCDDLRTEYLHLFLGEVSISQNVLDFYKTVMQLLVAVPDMFPYGEAATEVQ